MKSLQNQVFRALRASQPAAFARPVFTQPQQNLFTLRRSWFSTNADDGEAAAKAGAREFLNAVNDQENKIVAIDELNDVDEWKTKVMEAKEPVIVDCYADWCAPCKKLTPVLENIAREQEGQFKLVKINIDKDFTILADEFHFTNIIYNLLDNSIKYITQY